MSWYFNEDCCSVNDSANLGLLTQEKCLFLSKKWGFKGTSSPGTYSALTSNKIPDHHFNSTRQTEAMISEVRDRQRLRFCLHFKCLEYRHRFHFDSCPTQSSGLHQTTKNKSKQQCSLCETF